MRSSSETEARLLVLLQLGNPDLMNAIEGLGRDALDKDRCRVKALGFVAKRAAGGIVGQSEAALRGGADGPTVRELP